MIKRIEADHDRFRQIVRGKIKQELKKYITKDELIGKKGRDLVSIPVPQIEIPSFRYGWKEMGGVGQGEGEIGSPIGMGDDPAAGPEGGNMPGEHLLEVDITLDELAKILGEELELPNIELKGKENIIEERDKYTGIRRSGPESLRHFKRTFKRALKRQIISGTYDVSIPLIVPIKEDKRYRSWRTTPISRANAVIIYMMDVSGSMGDEQKEVVRIESFWIDTWLRYQYKGIETRYIIHDAAAREVDRETFFHTRENGGTKISSAYKLCDKLIDDSYSPFEWNIYPFHFSDGDNWGGGDTEECIALLRDKLLQKCNIFCYGQVMSSYGSGKFKKDLDNYVGPDDKLITSQIEGREGIYDSIKTFLGKGK